MLTSGPILGTLVEIVQERRCDLAGVVDATQVADVFQQWQIERRQRVEDPAARDRCSQGAPISGQALDAVVADGSVHDFMHAKVVVADDVAFVGSFNLSRSGERNAEDVLEIHERRDRRRAGRVRGRRTRALPAATVPSD